MKVASSQWWTTTTTTATILLWWCAQQRIGTTLALVHPTRLQPHRTPLSSSFRFLSSRTKATDSSSTATMTRHALRYVDTGANLLDDRYVSGTYRGQYRHEPDCELVLERAMAANVNHIILTAGTIEESHAAVAAVRRWRTQFPSLTVACTVGVHPTRCQQVFCENNTNNNKSSGDLLQELLDLAQDGKRDGSVVAIGEIGLDYDRLQFCSKQVQQEFLIQQLEHVAKPVGLPLFLHNRNVGTDLWDILQQHSDCWKQGGGVVHSFDDTFELAQQFLDVGLYIGINGCSLRTAENLAVVQSLPLNKLLLETDCPYCEVRQAHAGYEYIQTKFEAKAEKKYERGLCVKSRQEPCHIVQIAEIVAGVKGVPLQEVADACFDNSMQCFFASYTVPQPK